MPCRVPQESLPFEPIELGFPAALSCVMCHRQGFDQEGKALLDLIYLRMSLGEQGQTIRPKHPCPCGAPDLQALPHLGDPLLPLSLSCLRLTSLLGQRPPAKDRPLREQDRKPVLGREGYPCLCPLLRHTLFPAELMEPGRKAQ